MSEEVLAFRRAAAAAQAIEDLNRCFRAVARDHGFTAYAAGQVSPYDPKRPFLLLDWPKPWLELYAARGFASIDIAVQQAVQHPTPFTWTEAKQRFPTASAEIFAAAAGFGWTEGFVVPVHGPGPRRGIVSLAGSGPAVAGERRQRMEAICLTAYERARQLTETELREAEAFTPREAEVLALIAAGQSDGAIASALGISKTTAHFHAENARRKLGAATRAHAVALALARGLVRV
jgi:DNA-binding CsgD family transcriptional regulator